MVGTLVMAPKSVTFRRHDHLVFVLFAYQEIEDILGHSHQFALSVGLLLLYMDQALVVHIFFFKAIMQKG